MKRVANSDLHLGQYQRVIQGYDKAIQLDPNAMAYIIWGVSYAKLGQHQNVIPHYTKAIQIDGSYYGGFLAGSGHAFMMGELCG